MDFETLAIRFAPVGIALTERCVVRACNPAFTEIFGGPTEAMAAMALVDLYPGVEEYERIGAAGFAIMRDSGRYHDERIMRHLDGTLVWCRVGGRSLMPDEPFARAVWTFADMSADRTVIQLTDRERDVAIRTCQGLAAKKIARDLGLSHRTVEQYRARLIEKSGARNTAEFVALFSGMPL